MDSPARPLLPVNPWIIGITVTIATFMELLDTSIANVSLPYIAGGLGRSYDEVTWILTTYLVANAVILPMSAWFSRVIGRKTYYMACVALFTATSLICGIAPNLEFILIARVLQGIGGGGLAPVEQAILVDTFPPAKRASAFALYTVAIVTAPAIGPVIGGWITDNYNWRWVFLINIPIGLLSLFLTARFVKDPPAFEAERRSVRTNGTLRVDGVGVALIAVGSATLEMFLDRGQIDDWFGSKIIVAMFVVAVVCLTSAVFWELRQTDPVIDFRLLTTRNFAIANVFYFVFGFGLFATTAMIPQLLQSLFGYRAIEAGLVLGPGALVITILAPVGALLVQKKIVRPKMLLFGSVIVVGFALINFSRLTLATDYRHFVLGRALQGLGYAFFLVPLSVLSYSQLRPDQNNKASSLTNFFRNWGGSFGIAFVSTFTERRQDFHQAVVGANLVPSSPVLQGEVNRLALYLQVHGFSTADSMAASYGRIYAQLGAQTRFLGFMDCFLVIGMMTLLVAPLALFAKKTAPPRDDAPAH